MLHMLICLLFENRNQPTADKEEFLNWLNHFQEPQRYLCFSHEETISQQMRSNSEEKLRKSSDCLSLIIKVVLIH